MGVAGSGKTTVGIRLAELLAVAFADADAFHHTDAIRKMSSGTPLDDGDREPWLRRIAEWLRGRPDGAVVTCSALRRRYRDLLRANAGDVFFLHLAVDPIEAEQRLRLRPGHFMPASLVESQFGALEELTDDEDGLRVDGSRSPEEICDEALAALRCSLH
jgi:gluconokinase